MLIKNIFKDKTTLIKLIKVFLILMAIQIGYRIPLPFVNLSSFQAMQNILDYFGASSTYLTSILGNSKMGLFALSITPYITAAISLQLLSAAIPALEKIQKDGNVGRKKMEKLTYIISGFVAVGEALFLSISYSNEGLLANTEWYVILYLTIAWTAGALLLVWISNYITNKLIGNGISLMLLFNILGSLPNDISVVGGSFSDLALWAKILIWVGTAILAFLVFAYTVLINTAEKKIRVLSSHRIVAASDTSFGYIPLKLCSGGVMPILFASSVLCIPTIITHLFKIPRTGIWGEVVKCMLPSNWFNPTNMLPTLGVVIYVGALFLFSFIYQKIFYNPDSIAASLRRNGTNIEGARPGQETQDILKKELKSTLFVGACMLTVIALLPSVVFGLCQITSVSLSGTTFVILTCTILELRNKLEAETSKVCYKKFINNGGKKK